MQALAIIGILLLISGITSLISSRIHPAIIIKGDTFQIDGKEFHCGYTEKQMKLNILQEEIDKVRAGESK